MSLILLIFWALLALAFVIVALGVHPLLGLAIAGHFAWIGWRARR